MRSQRGTLSAADTPTGASASIGETLYTWRAAIADAATLVNAVGRDGDRDRVAGQPVFDAGLEDPASPSVAGRPIAMRPSAIPSSDPMVPPISPRIAASAEHVADDGRAPAADRAQHRDDRAALGDRHGHRRADQERADHQRDRRAHERHVVHQLDAVTGPGGPQARCGDDGPAVHGSR